MNESIIRGRILNFNRRPTSINDLNSFEYIEDGALLINDGIILKLGFFNEIIKGSPKDLKTTVNPIKTLTPRFITRTLEKIKKTD